MVKPTPNPASEAARHLIGCGAPCNLCLTQASRPSNHPYPDVNLQRTKPATGAGFVLFGISGIRPSSQQLTPFVVSLLLFVVSLSPFVVSLSNHKQVNSNSLILKNLPSPSTSSGRTAKTCCNRMGFVRFGFRLTSLVVGLSPFVVSLSNHKQVKSNSLILKNLPSHSTSPGRTAKTCGKRVGFVQLSHNLGDSPLYSTERIMVYRRVASGKRARRP